MSESVKKTLIDNARSKLTPMTLKFTSVDLDKINPIDPWPKRIRDTEELIEGSGSTSNVSILDPTDVIEYIFAGDIDEEDKRYPDWVQDIRSDIGAMSDDAFIASLETSFPTMSREERTQIRDILVGGPGRIKDLQKLKFDKTSVAKQLVLRIVSSFARLRSVVEYNSMRVRNPNDIQSWNPYEILKSSLYDSIAHQKVERGRIANYEKVKEYPTFFRVEKY